MTPHTLRDASHADAAEIAQLHADSWRRHYRGAYADSFLDGDIFADRRSVWSERFASPSNSSTIVADDDGAVVGFVHVIFDDDDRWGSLVDNLHVTVGRQRSGIGRALLAHAAQAVIENASSRSMYLWVLEQNATAQQFYSALGGINVETATCQDPDGSGKLNGSPKKLRLTWPDSSTLCD